MNKKIPSAEELFRGRDFLIQGTGRHDRPHNKYICKENLTFCTRKTEKKQEVVKNIQIELAKP